MAIILGIGVNKNIVSKLGNQSSECKLVIFLNKKTNVEAINNHRLILEYYTENIEFYSTTLMIV